DAIVRAVGIRHAVTVSREADDVGHTIRRGVIDRWILEAEQPLVIILSIQGDRDRAARTAGIHRRYEAVLLQRRPVVGTNEIEAFDTEARCLAAAVLERCAAREHAACNALLDAPFAGGWRRRRRGLPRLRGLPASNGCS